MEARKSAKLLAWLIALAVVFTMTLPSSVVWAAEGDAVASIGDETYTTVQGAVDNAKAGEVIVMQSDVECATINVSDAEKKITLDLNGKTIRNKSTNDVILVQNGAELTVEDNSVAKDYVYSEENYPEYTGGKLISKGNGAISVVGNINDATWNETSIHSKVTVNGGALIGQEGALFAQGNGAEITLNDGYAVGLDNAVIAGNGTQKNGIGINGGTTINVNGGVMIGNIETRGYISCGIYHPQSGVLNITGGTIVSKKGLGILMRNGTLNLQSCNIEARGAEDLAGWVGDKKTTPGADGIVIDYSDDAYNSNNTPTDTRKVNISGGTIKSENQKALTVVEDDSQKTTDISITGGTFSTNPGKYIADGYLADKTEDGYQIIKEGDATENVALVGKTYYPTLKEAIDAAEAGDTVTLLKDITVDMGTDKNAAAIAITKNLTLDGNGKTIAANKIDAEEGMGHILGIQGANVKVKDLTIDGADKSARHGIQVYGEGSKATLYSVTVKNCFGYGLVVNGATATATRLTTDGNGWGGVNVTKGVNITDNPSFTLNSGTLTDENPIQIDVEEGDLDADWVTFGEGAGEWDIITDAETGDDRPAIQWKPAKGEAVAQVNGSNYATLEAAITAAKENATVKLLKDIEFSVDGETDKNTSLIKINKALTLDGNGKTITVKGNVTEGKGHVIGIFDGAKVTVTDLTIDGGKAARHGIQTYINGSKATLQNVTVKNCLGYGVVANGSTIIADELYTSGNAWGGVNVSKGSGVKEEPKFVFNGGKLKAEVEGTAPIQIDNVDTAEPINEKWVQFGENEEGNWHYEKIGETKIHWLEGAPIESITLNTESIKLEVGDKAQLIATVSPENAYNKDVTWSVPEGTKAIEVDADTGVVTALEKTEAVVVTATAKDGKKDTCKITVEGNADETTTLTVQPSVTNGTINANDIITAINNAEKEEATEILVDVPDNANNVISKDVFAAAKEGKAGKLIIKTEKATFTFDAAQIENAADVNVEITDAKDVDVNEWLPGATTEAIELTHDGNFPAPATITYTLTAITGVDTVYLYYYNDGALELIAQDAITVAEDNSVTFTLAHASAYVFSTEKVEAATVADNVEQAIKAIGTVTYTDESKAAIEKAREQYDLFVAQYADDKDLVTNLKTLTDAEAAYKALDDGVQAFKAKLDAFCEDVDGTMTYEQQKQVPELKAAYDALDANQKKALEAEGYKAKLDQMDEICEASQNAEIVSQANRVSKAVAEKLPTNVAFTTAVKSQIDAVRALYDSVVAETPDAKVLLTSELEAIEKAEAAYKTAKRAAYSSAKISLSTTKYTYNGKAKRPTVKGLSAFVNGTDYTIAYKSNVKSGKATVTVTGKGDCAGFSAKTATFRIVPNKAAISKLTKGKRNMKVRIKSQKKAAVSGYQIAYKYGKSGKYKKVTTTKLTKKIRKLKTKKYYYVKVRAYKKIDGKKYYGTYSKIKKIKVR